MPETRLSRGRLRVSYPDTHTATRTRPRRDRALGTDPHAVLLEALRDNDFEKVEELRLAPRRGLDLAGATPGRVRLELEMTGEQDAVVLVEQDGCYSWHLPATATARSRTRRLPGERHAAVFDIDLAANRAAYGKRRSRGLPTGARQRGLFGDLISGAVRLVVLKFTAPWLVGQAIGFLERHVQPGLVHLTEPDPARWRRVDTLADVGLPTERPARVLLLVHGTFSSTVSAFGAMGLVGGGPQLLREAIAGYDAVVGFDHPTLSVDPLANATDLLRRVSSVTTGVTLDVLTHSRGGLTTRSFAECVLPGSGWNGTVDKAVFVAATNAGTNLANPDRWYDLIDVTTNLTMVAGGLLGAIPGGAPVAAVVGGVIRGLGALVKYLGGYALEQGGVPGLAAMMPEGDFVRGINQTQPGQPQPGTSWFVARSNFHVTLGDDSHRPPEFPKELAVRLAEGLVDRIFRADNDLVVDSASMSAIDAPVGGFVADTLDFGTNDVVYHGNYFVQDEFGDRLRRWLLLEPSTTAAPAPPPDPAPAPPTRSSSSPTRSLGGAGAAGGGAGPRGPRRPRAHRDTAPSAPPALEIVEREASAGAAPVSPADAGAALPEPVTAQLRAELPAAPLVAQPATLRVALSRNEIRPTPGSAGVDAPILVTPGRTLTVEVTAKANAKFTGNATDTFELPAGGGTSELEFHVVPLVPGPVTVVVRVRDGVVPIGQVELTTTAVAAAAVRAGTAEPVSASGTLLAGGDQPDLDDALWLEVTEVERDGGTVFLYTVRAPSRGLLERYESPVLADREGYVVELFRDLSRSWGDNGATPGYLSALQDRGAQLFDELFPEPLRRLLWAERAHLGSIVLLSDEPYIPWELVHLKPVGRPRPKTTYFLGQLGLVRWQYTGFPQATLRARTGKVWALCPDYVDPNYRLVEQDQEARFLADRLGARPAKGREKDVTTLLRKGGFDVLHFSGHGVSDPTDSAAAKILLAGRRVRGKVAQEYLSATAVAQNARLRTPEGSGPLVVLNACQVARGGHQLSTLGGFARAFLEAGAAAYVSTLWSVGEAPARAFVETLYERLLAGETVAEATAAGRTRAREAGDATWLAYAVYARPDARLVTS